jgi:hypothetical protein
MWQKIVHRARSNLTILHQSQKRLQMPFMWKKTIKQPNERATRPANNLSLILTTYNIFHCLSYQFSKNIQIQKKSGNASTNQAKAIVFYFIKKFSRGIRRP